MAKPARVLTPPASQSSDLGRGGRQGGQGQEAREELDELPWAQQRLQHRHPNAILGRKKRKGVVILAKLLSETELT